MDPRPPKYISPRGVWMSKLALRAASTLFLVIMAGIAGSLATMPRVDALSIVAIMLAPALIVTFCWNLAEAICILKRGGHRGMHPGAIVAIDLLAWLGWGVVVLFLAAFGMVTRARHLIDDHSGYSSTYGGYDPDLVTPEDAALEAKIGNMGRATVAFAILNTIAHFVLFVIGCYETNLRNRMARTVYVMQPIYGPPPGQGAYHPLGAQSQPALGGSLPGQPPAVYAPDTKTGPERFA